MRALSLVLGAFVAAGSVSPLLAQSRTIERTVRLEPGGHFSLRATKGSVKLVSWDRSEVEIKARIESTSMRRAAGQEAVDATTVDIVGEGDTVRVRSNYDKVPREWTPFGDSRTVPDIHYEIRAPRRLEIWLDIDRSDTEISGFDGRVRIEADRSELRVEQVTGELRVRVDRGGRSRFEGVTGSVNVRSDRTDIDLRLAELQDAGRLSASRGQIDIRVPASHPLTVRTDIDRRSRFASDLPLTMTGSTRSPRGEINGGGPTLTIIARRSRVELRPL